MSQKPSLPQPAKSVSQALTPGHGDTNHTIDPVFRVVGWSARENFADLLPDEAPQIEHAPVKQIGATYTTGRRPVEAEPLGDNEPLSADFEPPEF